MGRIGKEGLDLVTADVFLGNATDAIEQQEKRGQEDLVNSTSLPSEIGYCETKEMYAKIGITFSNPYEDDPLFCDAKLPEGWKKEGTEHAMHSVIRDDKGRERIRVFYKAAFYDRKAHMHLISRYNVTYADCVEFTTDPDHGFIVLDYGVSPNVVMYREYYQKGDAFSDDPKSWYRELDEKHRKCVDWLDENYPNHRDPTAYWDE